MKLSDNFNRPDAPTLGPNWSALTGPGISGSTPAIRSNRLGSNSSDISYYQAVYTGKPALPPDHYAEMVLADLSGSWELQLILRSTPPTSPLNHYAVAIQVGAFIFVKYANGGFSLLTGNLPISPAWTAGDVVRAEAIGNKIRLLRNSVLVHEITDSAIKGGGFAGVSIATNSLQTAVDDWSAGPLGSLTEQIVRAVVAALDSAGKPAGLTVNRSRRQSIEKSQLPMMSVYSIREEVGSATEGRRSPLVERRLRVQVKCRIAGDDQANDLLRTWAVEAVMKDQSLNGLALGIAEESTDWDADDASDGDYSVAAVDFLVRYSTSRFSLESKT